MLNIDEWTITNAVLEAQAGCSNARLQTVMTSLVRHLHEFAREVQLTESEWFEGIRFLTRAGHITDDKRQEFILLSDVLGLSTLVTAQNNSKPAGCTEATVFGPFSSKARRASNTAPTSRTVPRARRASCAARCARSMARRWPVR